MGYAANIGFGSFDHDARRAFGLTSLSEGDGSVARRENLLSDRPLVEIAVSRLIAERRDRAKFFPRGLFSDPAWEIMLAVALAESRQHRLDITSLCAGVDVPPTTVLRWISILIGHGILRRLEDTTDRRRKYVELTPTALAKMYDYVSGTDKPEALAA